MSDTHQFTHNKTFYFSHKKRRQLVWNEFSTSKTAEWWGLLRERTSRGNNGKLTRQLQKVKEEEEKLACSNSWLWKEWKVEKSTLHAFTLVLKSSNSIFVPLCVVEAIYTRHETWESARGAVKGRKSWSTSCPFAGNNGSIQKTETQFLLNFFTTAASISQ